MEAPKIVGKRSIDFWNEKERRVEKREEAVWDRSTEYMLEYALWSFKGAAPTADVRIRYKNLYGQEISAAYASNIMTKMARLVRAHRIYRGVWLHDDNRKYVWPKGALVPAVIAQNPVIKNPLFDDPPLEETLVKEPPKPVTERPSLFD